MIFLMPATTQGDFIDYIYIINVRSLTPPVPGRFLYKQRAVVI